MCKGFDDNQCSTHKIVYYVLVISRVHIYSYSSKNMEINYLV